MTEPHVTVAGYRYTKRDSGWTVTLVDFDHRTPVDPQSSSLLDHIMSVQSERDALREDWKRLVDASLARLAQGCSVCGVMNWKVNTNGEHQCRDCGNVFDLPIVAEGQAR